MGNSLHQAQINLKPEEKYSKKGLACVVQMSQGNTPTREQFLAARNEDSIDTNQEGERIILETVYNRTS